MERSPHPARASRDRPPSELRSSRPLQGRVRERPQQAPDYLNPGFPHCGTLILTAIKFRGAARITFALHNVDILGSDSDGRWASHLFVSRSSVRSR